MMVMDSLQLHLPSLPPVKQFLHQTSFARPRQTLLNLNITKLQHSDEDIIGNAMDSLRKAIDKKDLKLGSCLHAKAIQMGIHTDVFVANSILDMYLKCGHLKDADILFEEMSYRTVVTWTCMIWGYCSMGLVEKSLLMYCKMLEFMQPNEHTLAVLLQASAQCGVGVLFPVVHGYAVKCGFMGNGFLQNCLIGEYSKYGMVEDAERLIESWHCRDVVSWTSLISGCVGIGMVERAIALFFRMQEDEVVPNEVTILSVLKACSDYKNFRLLSWVHGLILKAKWQRHASVLNSMVETYSTNGCYREATKLFCEFCFTGEGMYLNSETMANFIQVCGHSGSLRLGKGLHGYLIKNGYFPCTVIENSLMDLYAVNEKASFAFQLFTRMSTKDIISWNTLIKCLVENGQPSKALSILNEIHINGAKDTIFPDFVTMLSSLKACSDTAALLQGQVIHGYITKTGILGDRFIQNSLIDMYSKSGKLDIANKVFKDMKDRDSGSWNSIIAAHGSHGNGTTVLEHFSEMSKSVSCRPNAITFSNVLSACAHAGLVKEGLDIFNRMETEYNVEPSQEHYTCIVDLLGRSGRVEEAKAFAMKIPPSCPSPDVWGALLGACLLFDNNLTIAEKAAKELAILDPYSSVWRITLSNVYAKAGRWNEVAKLRAEIQRSEDINKGGGVGGWSLLSLKGCEFKFLAGDTKNSESGKIFQTLNVLHKHMIDQTW